MDEGEINKSKIPQIKSADTGNDTVVGATDDTARLSPSVSPTVGREPATMSVSVGQVGTGVDSETIPEFRHQVTTPEHALGTQAVPELVREAMLPRSQRSIERYCCSGKLDAFFDDATKQYWITRISVDRLIANLKKSDSHGSPLPDNPVWQSDKSPRPSVSVSSTVGHEPATMSDSVGQSQETSSATPNGNVGENKDVEIKELKAELERKEREIRNLEIADKVKDSLLQRTIEQFSGFLDRLTEASRKVGQLENENRRLRELPPGQSVTSRDTTEERVIYRAETE